MQTESQPHAQSSARRLFSHFLAPHREPIGVRYALRIAAGILVAWIVFRQFGVTYPIWAIITVVTVSEIELRASYLETRGRVAHTGVGCAIGLLALELVGAGIWQLCIACVVASLVSFYLVNLGTNWRTAPVATVIVMARGIQQFSKWAGYQAAIERTIEVLGGCIIALAVTWVAAKLWPTRSTEAQIQN